MPKDKQITIERIPSHFETLQLPARQPGESLRFRAIVSACESPVSTLPYRTKIRKGAFKRTLNDRSMRVKVLASHDQSAVPIGLPLELRETEVGLEVAASLNETQAGRDWAAAIRHAKKLNKLSEIELSIGFDALQEQLEEDEATGEMFRIITELRLWKFSLTAFGADRQTVVTEAASLGRMLRGEPSDEELELELLEADAKMIELGLFDKEGCLR